MTILFFFAKATKQKISNYPWLDYERIFYMDKRTWEKEVKDYFKFEDMLLSRFQNELIDKYNFNNVNKEVLVLAFRESYSDYTFFKPDGKLAELFRNNKLDELYKEFLTRQ